MSILLGFTLFITFIMLVYMVVKIFQSKKMYLIIFFMLQVFAFSIALFSFITKTQTNIIAESIFVVLGCLIPLAYFAYDYFKTVNTIKKHSIFEGFFTSQRKEDLLDKKENDDLKPLRKGRKIHSILREFDEATEDIIKNLKKMLFEAHVFIDKGDYEKARHIYSFIFRLNKSSSVTLYNLANMCYKTGNYPEALVKYTNVLELNDKKTDEEDKENSNKDNTKYMEHMVYFNLGNTLYRLKKYDDALKAYEKAHNINPGLDDANENIARTLIAMNKKSEALNYYKKVVENNHRNVQVYYTMASLYYEAGQNQKAIDALNTTVTLDNKFKKAHRLVSIILEEEGRYEEAVNTYKKLISLTDDDYKIFYDYAMVLKNAGKIDESIYALKRATDLNENDCGVYVALCKALEETKKYEEGCEFASKIIKLKPEYVQGYNILGRLKFLQGRSLEAMEVYSKGLKVDPDDYMLNFNMGVVLSSLKRYYEAEDYFNIAVQINPEAYEAYYHLGSSLVQLRKYSQAVEAYKIAMQSNNKDAKLFYEISYVYAVLKQNELASENLKKAIELSPELEEKAKKEAVFKEIIQDSEFRIQNSEERQKDRKDKTI